MAIRLNVEIKARCLNPKDACARLLKAKAEYVGLDRQRDTYFVAGSGRLKLREGTIENTLIAYSRPDTAGPKASNVRLFRSDDQSDLRDVLTAALTVDIVVEKSRHIFFLDNVKVHVDTVPPLGNFVEIEAIDTDGTVGRERLEEQCLGVMDILDVRLEQLVALSYSDLLRLRRARPLWQF